MAYKNHYKKIFVVGAALFVFFALAGMATKINIAHAQQTTGGGSGLTIPTVPLQTLSLPGTSIPAATTPAAGSTGSTAPPVMGTTNGPANTAPTQPNVLSCSLSPATCGIYLVSLVANGVAALLLTVAAWLVKLGLQFNDNIFNSPAVQTGFSVSLAIANLGFVLGIIIIAIATILRNQTYGLKQLLWKLVMMAILVNFGLVITAPIVSFANSMSTYFINATSPSAATGGYAAYVETMMSAFAPQTINLANAQNQTTFCNSWVTYEPITRTICELAGQSVTSPPASSDAFWQNTMALLFDVAFSSTAAFTFLALAVLLIIRYLMLGGLLIVLPLAWLTYVFPKFDNSFSKWWNTFVKWVFFPPLALFFIYLAFITAAKTNNTGAAGTATNDYISAATSGTGTDVTQEKALVTQTGLFGGVFVQTADEILLVGLMIMGLMFASSLSGKAGKATVGAVSGASKAFGTWAGKTGRKAGYSAAARVAQPKPRVDPATGAIYSPITGPRANVARWLRGQANRKDLQTPGSGVLGKTTGLAGSVFGGAKKGSGLFKDKSGVKDWSCKVCGSIIRSTKKPTGPCPQGHTAAQANWTAVG